MLSALAFVFAFGALTWLALRRDPVGGVYVYMLTFYVHPPSRWWGPMLPDLRWSFTSAVVALLALWVHRHRLNKPPRPFIATVPGLVLVLYALLLWVQNLWALEPEDHMRASILVTKYIVAFYLIYRLADTPRRASGVLLAHVMGCLYLGWLAYNIGRGEGSRLDGVGGPGIDDANTLGTHLVTGFVVGAALVISFVGWRRIAAALSVPLILNGLVLTGSRGAFLGLLSGSGLLYMVRPQRRRWMFWVFGLLGLALTLRVADDQFIERMFSIKSAAQGDENIDMSAESRLVIVEAQLRMFLDYPQGVGQKGTAVLSGGYMDEKWLTRGSSDDEGQRSSHNTFMTVLTEQGIPGVLLYLWISLWGVGAVFRIRSAQRRGADRDTVTAAGAAAAGLAVIWVAGNFADYLLMEAQIWLLAVLALSMDRLRSQAAQVQVGTSQRPAQAQAQAN